MAVSKAAESVTLGNAASKVARKTRKAADATKAAPTGADGEMGATRSDQSDEPQVQRRNRKIRSDASIPRKPRVHVAKGEAPLTGELPVSPDTETSALALSSAAIPNDDQTLQ